MATFRKSEDYENLTTLLYSAKSFGSEPKHCTPISERMGQRGILEAAFQVSRVHRMVTFLMEKDQHSECRAELLYLPCQGTTSI